VANKPYDATAKRLLEIDPPAWLACAGLTPTGPVRVIDSDLSTVTAEADTMFAVGDPIEYLAHIELQSGRDRTLPLRLLRYNVLLNYRHARPVRSIAILLRAEADGPELTGVHQVRHAEGDAYLDFRYSTVRVWDLDLESVLSGGLGTLPLAPLTRDALADPADAIRRMKQRLSGSLPDEILGELWSATGILMGLKYPDRSIVQLLRGVRAMKESTFYQAILAEGRAEGRVEGRAEAERRAVERERRILIAAGGRCFGPPDASVLAALGAIRDEDRLCRLGERLADAQSWDELLATP
jgi:predicted transposase YdaD